MENNKIQCLDHGFVKLLNISGPVHRTTTVDGFRAEVSSRDTDPAMAARISFDNFEEVRTEEQDMKLVEYLIAHHHSSPLEMTTIWLEFKLPIFVARQFMRHRMCSYNEVSGRYATLPAEWYIPEVVGGKAKSNKQGQEDNLNAEDQRLFRNNLDSLCEDSYHQYKMFMDKGVAPEHARMFLHLNHYTHYIMKTDLHNMMHFLSLRLDGHAQVEARVYAQAVYDLLSLHLTKSMELFDKYKRIQYEKHNSN